MAKPRRLVLISTVAMMLLVTAARSVGEATPTPQTQPSAAAPPSQPHSEQAYSLPPDKLAQAIALNKIRVALDIVGSLWGLVGLFWLLASGTATRLDVR